MFHISNEGFSYWLFEALHKTFRLD